MLSFIPKQTMHQIIEEKIKEKKQMRTEFIIQAQQEQSANYIYWLQMIDITIPLEKNT